MTTRAAADYDGHFPNDTIGGWEGMGTQNQECHTTKPEPLFRRFRSGSAEVEQILARRFLHRSPWKTRLTSHFKIIFPAIVKCLFISKR